MSKPRVKAGTSKPVKPKRAKREPKKAHGRPSKFTTSLGQTICDRLAAGETLRSICRDDGMPDEKAVRDWARGNETFSPQYARAREVGYAVWFDEIREIADTPQAGVKTVRKLTGVETTEGDMIEHRRLQIDARKWMLAKALPKVYGDKIDVNHGASDELLDALMAAGERAKNVPRG